MDSADAAYAAFPFLMVMTLLGAWFTYRLFRLGRYYSAEVCSCNVKIHYHAVAIVLLLLYFSVGFAFLILTAIRGHSWADWSWRWSIGGALLDSVCAIKETKQSAKFENAIHFQAPVALIEALLLVIISPAIPNPTVTKYLTFGAVICHALWTAFSAWFWTPSLKRTIRLGASVGQAAGAIVLIWNPLGFVILMYTCTFIVFAEELGKPQQTFWRIRSIQRPTARILTTDTGQIYKIVFLGKGSQRLDSLRRVLNWPPVRVEVGGVSLYDHPTRGDTTLASVPPDMALHSSEKEGYIRAILKGATAVVLVFSLCDTESFGYVKGLRGFPAAQPGLLVACRDPNEIQAVEEQSARELAAERGWAFTTLSNIEEAFNDMVGGMFARPPIRHNDSNMARPQFAV